MQLHQLKPNHKQKYRKRVGRGGYHGSFSGRGVKGQRVRAGRKMPPVIRELIKRYPKLRGYRASVIPGTTAVINTGTLEKKFNPAEIVNPQALLEKKLIRRIRGRVPKVKILAKGELTKKFIIEKCSASKAAQEKIEKAGGAIKN